LPAPEGTRPIAQRRSEAADARGARRKIRRRAARGRHDAPPVRFEGKRRQVAERRQNDVFERAIGHRLEERQMPRLPFPQPRRKAHVVQQRCHEHGLARLAQAGDSDPQAPAKHALAQGAGSRFDRRQDAVGKPGGVGGHVSRYRDPRFGTRQAPV
jgi:hypothetical protein